MEENQNQPNQIEQLTTETAELLTKQANELEPQKNLLEGFKDAFEDAREEVSTWSKTYVKIRKSHLDELERLAKLSGRVDIEENVVFQEWPFFLKLQVRAHRHWWYTSNTPKKHIARVGKEYVKRHQEYTTILNVSDPTITNEDDPRVEEMFRQFYMVLSLLKATFEGFRERHAPEANKDAKRQFEELKEKFEENVKAGNIHIDEHGVRRIVEAGTGQSPKENPATNEGGGKTPKAENGVVRSTDEGREEESFTQESIQNRLPEDT